MDQRILRRAARNKVLLSLLAIAGIVAAEVVAVIVVIMLGLDDESLWADLVTEVAGAAAAVGGVYLLGGSSLARPERKDVTFTLRYGWWCLAVGVGLMLFDLGSYWSQGTAVSDQWPLLLAQTALLCLAIGIFEEFMFRGIIFQGLLAVMGSTHKGVVRAVMLTSVLFGCAHVSFDTDFVDALSTAQAVLKIVQTGLYSLMLCVIVLRTRRLGGVSFFHGLDDFLIIAPSVVLFNEPLSTEYVVQGEGGYEVIAVYLIVIALYLPFVIKSLRDLRRGQDATRGVFMEKAEAEAAAAAQAAAAQEAEATAAARLAAAAQVAAAAQMVASAQMQAPAQPVANVAMQAPAQPQQGMAAPVPPAPAAASVGVPPRPRDGRPPVPDGL